MSQLMESMLNRGVTQANQEAVGAPQQPQQGIDFVKVLWRWKWLPILGAMIGAGVGFMFYTKMPERFRSEALVQVGYALPVVASELYDPEKVAPWASQKDETRVIKSQKVLDNAVKIGNLTQYFEGMSDFEIVFELMDQKLGVSVDPAEKSERVTSQQMIISYVSYDAEKSQAVVDAVIDGYQAFLHEEYKSVDYEMLTYFKKMEQETLKSIDDLNTKYKNFQDARNNVLWNVDEAVDPYFEEYQIKRQQLGQISSQRIRLKSLLQQVTDARKAGRRPQDCLMMLNEGSDLVMSTLWGRLFEDKDLTGGMDKESEKLERTALVQLEAKLQELLRRFGSNHPSVLSIKAGIESVKQQIAAARQHEEKTEKMLEASRDKSAIIGGLGINLPQKTLASNSAVGAEVALGSEGPAVTEGLSVSEDLAGAPGSETKEGSEERQELTLESMTDHWLQMSLNALTDKYQALGLEERDLQELAQQELQKSQELQHVLRENNLLQEQILSMKELHSTFSDKVRTFEFTPENANHKILRELNPASMGLYDGPYPSRYVAGGALLGMLVMSGLAILMDLADRSYRSPDEIVADLGRPVLGHVPAMDLPNIKKVIDSVDASIITLHHSRGRIAEAFRSVRTGLFFSSRGSDLKVVQITSPVPGDGKSTLSANLAVTMAQSGRRVLLVDADFRRPRLHKLFGIEVEAGLAQLVNGEAEFDEVTYTTSIANLSLMAGGKRPNNPAELLASNRFAEIVEVLREKYDIVIIDTPPLLAVSDPSVVASLVDGVVLTMRLRRNVKPLATRSFRVLEAVDAKILGVVVNGVSTEAAYGGYGYNYSYNDYRYSYRSNYNYGYGYLKYNNYSQYSAGYIEDKQSDAAAESRKNDAHS